VPESAARARALVREVADERRIDGRTTWDLMLATTEAVANAVEHGSPCDPRGIRLSVMAEDDSVHVEVGDCGCFSRVSRTAKRPSEGGRGMPLIQAVTDHFEVVPEGGMTRVRFLKRVA
jgi:serine/threonine-protein kinase RsbW